MVLIFWLFSHYCYFVFDFSHPAGIQWTLTLIYFSPSQTSLLNAPYIESLLKFASDARVLLFSHT